MRKVFIAVAAGLATLVAGCSCTPVQQQPQQVYYDQTPAYSQPVQQAPVVVQQDRGMFGGHGDAIIAAGAGYMAGKAMQRRDDRRYDRPRYYSKPAKRSFFSSPKRSSSYGSFRSTRRR